MRLPNGHFQNTPGCMGDLLRSKTHVQFTSAAVARMGIEAALQIATELDASVRSVRAGCLHAEGKVSEAHAACQQITSSLSLRECRVGPFPQRVGVFRGLGSQRVPARAGGLARQQRRRGRFRCYRGSVRRGSRHSGGTGQTCEVTVQLQPSSRRVARKAVVDARASVSPGL